MKPQAHLEIVMVPTDDLKMYENNAKQHPTSQVEQIANSIEEFNFADPIAAWHNDDGESVIVEGHGRLMAAKKLGIEELPVIYLDYMSDSQRKAYAIAHNALTMNSDFDLDLLSVEVDGLQVEFDMEDFGVDMSKLELGFEPSFDDVEDEQKPDESVTVKVLFHDPNMYQNYRQYFSEMEHDGASVSIS